MKSKQDEINQFKGFLKNLEPGGYLDMILGGLLPNIERQIQDDHGFSIAKDLDDFSALKWHAANLETSLEQTQKRNEEEVAKLKTEIAELRYCINSNVSQLKNVQHTITGAVQSLEKSYLIGGDSY